MKVMDSLYFPEVSGITEIISQNNRLLIFPKGYEMIQPLRMFICLGMFLAFERFVNML